MSGEAIDVSVLLATYNRAEVLDETLTAMEALRTDGLRWEVLVADNNSSDRTGEVLAGHQGRLPLRHVFVARQGKSAALNVLLERARGELLVFTDDDVLPEPSWLLELSAASRRWPGAIGFGGPCHDRFVGGCPAGLPEAIRGVIRLGEMDLGGPERPFGPDELPVGAGFALRRAALESGGQRFSTQFGPIGSRRVAGNEIELMMRLRAAGGAFVYVPSAVVNHQVFPRQIEPVRLRQRAYAFGRGLARTHTFGQSPRVAHVPRFFLRLWVRSAALCLVHRLTRRRTALLRQQLLRARNWGAICESYRMGRRRGAPV